MRRAPVPTSLTVRFVLGVLLAASVLFGTAVGGARFVWCEPMQRALLRCCCPKAPAQEECPAVARSCCVEQRLASLPRARGGDVVDRLVAPAPRLAHALEATWPDPAEASTRPPRARARARAPDERRIERCVALL
ncbi:MAG: hypothetical protein NZ898_01415 [Myxococcota bacterium]|nr:hypothetical protein [Myxococcota bacterium]